MWPVDAVVGENGAFYFLFRGHLEKRYRDLPELRARNREQLAKIAQDILAAVPGCAIASDQAYRETDLAIDYCEDVPPLPLAAAERIAALMRQAGALPVAPKYITGAGCGAGFAELVAHLLRA